MDLRVEVGAGAGTPTDPAVVVAVGSLDARTAPRLREQLVALCAQDRHHVVVDLDGVELLDATGLGVLVAALRRVRPHGGSVRLVCTRPDVRRVLEVVGVTGMLPLHPTVQHALTAA